MDISSLNDIQNLSTDESVTFKLSQLDIPVRNLFLIIRNLSLNPEQVKLDFTDVDKQQWINEYLTTDVEVEIKDLLEKIVDELRQYVNYVLSSKKEVFLNIEDKLQMYSLLCNFCWSSIYYAVQIQTNKNMFKQTTSEDIPVNAIFLLKYIDRLELEICKLNLTPTFYSAKFIEDNNLYFSEILKTSKYGILLYGSTTPQWNKFTELMRMLKSF